MCVCVRQVREVPGITIFRSSATIYFANAELYLEALKQKVHICFSFIQLSQRTSMTHCLPSFFLSCFCGWWLWLQSGLDITKMITYKRRQEEKQRRRERRAERRAKRAARRQVEQHIKSPDKDHKALVCLYFSNKWSHFQVCHYRISSLNYLKIKFCSFMAQVSTALTFIFASGVRVCFKDLF